MDEDIEKVFSLSSDCDGAPCRVVEVKECVIRRVAVRPGELRLRVDNRTALHTLCFEVKRLGGDDVSHQDEDTLSLLASTPAVSIRDKDGPNQCDESN